MSDGTDSRRLDGVGELASWLRECGYDVSSTDDGQDIFFPAVEIRTSPGRMVWEVDRLYTELKDRGTPFEREEVDLQCVYSPVDRSARIVLMGVRSSDVDI